MSNCWKLHAAALMLLMMRFHIGLVAGLRSALVARGIHSEHLVQTNNFSNV